MTQQKKSLKPKIKKMNNKKKKIIIYNLLYIKK